MVRASINSAVFVPSVVQEIVKDVQQSGHLRKDEDFAVKRQKFW